MGVISLLLPVLGIPLGLAAWIMGAKDLGKMRKGQMDAQGEGTTQAGLICGIIGMVLQLLTTLTCVAPMLLGFVFAATAPRMVAPVRRPVTMRVGPVPVAPAPAPAPVPEEGEEMEKIKPAPAPAIGPNPAPGPRPPPPAPRPGGRGRGR